MKFKNIYTMQNFVSAAVVFTEESQTIPDQSLSVRDILERFTRSTIGVSELERPVYYDKHAEEDFNDNDFGTDEQDITYIHEAVDRYETSMTDIKSRVKEFNNHVQEYVARSKQDDKGKEE